MDLINHEGWWRTKYTRRWRMMDSHLNLFNMIHFSFSLKSFSNHNSKKIIVKMTLYIKWPWIWLYKKMTLKWKTKNWHFRFVKVGEKPSTQIDRGQVLAPCIRGGDVTFFTSWKVFLITTFFLSHLIRKNHIIFNDFYQFLEFSRKKSHQIFSFWCVYKLL